MDEIQALDPLGRENAADHVRGGQGFGKSYYSQVFALGIGPPDRARSGGGGFFLRRGRGYFFRNGSSFVFTISGVKGLTM